ncbi:MAG TPA: cytochrome c oxidase assembly protein [Pseudogracilibacillus sp.]|nr:cytochrome c oxidase assembly protein [Pseudogracilibacillus sp.]
MQFLLEHHSWYALFQLHWLVILGLAVYFYYKKIQHSPIYKVTGKHLFSFYTAIFSLLLIKVTPLTVLAQHYLFSAQVFADSIIFFVIVPLFILGFPVSFYRRYVWDHRVKFALRILSHPWLTLIVFNGVLTVYYVPTIFNIAHSNYISSALVQILLTFTAFFMWWVILQPIPELKNFEFLLRAAYIFFASVALMPIGFFFLIKLEAHFPIYIENAHAIIPALTPIYDQQLAGGVLKITQMFSYAVALLFIMFSWAKSEQEFEGQADDKHIRYVRGIVVHLPKDDKDKT